MSPKRPRGPRKPTLVQQIRKDLKLKRATLKRQLKVVLRDLKSVGIKGAAKRAGRRTLVSAAERLIARI